MRNRIRIAAATMLVGTGLAVGAGAASAAPSYGPEWSPGYGYNGPEWAPGAGYNGPEWQPGANPGSADIIDGLFGGLFGR